MKRLVLILLVFLTMAAAHAASRPQGQQPDIDTGIKITGTTAAARVAVPEFLVESGDPKAASLAATFNQVLWDDLDYSGPLVLASRSFYPSAPVRSPADIRAEDWTKPGVEAAYIVFGTIHASGSEFSVNAQLHDIKSTSRVFGNRYTSRDASDKAVRMMAHRFADDILEKLGFRRGVAQTEIAFVCDRRADGTKEICVMGYDGQDVTPVTAVGLALTPSWSPDSKKIAYTSYREGMNIEIINRENLRRLAFPLLNGLSMMPAWAPPNGRQIAFASTSRNPRSDTRILVGDDDGKNIRELTRSDRADWSPVWNPVTGKEIIFASNRSPNAESASQLYITDSEGTNVRLLGKPGGATNNPAWSPDGQLVAFAWQKSGTGNRRDIWVLNLRSGQMSQLTDNDGDNERPSWAPDQRHIVFASNRSGSMQIYTMLADGRKVRTLTRGGKNEGPAWSGYLP